MNKKATLCLVLLSILLVAFTQYSDWQTLSTKNLPANRHENLGVAVGKDYYLLGGRGYRPVNIYRSKENVWDTIAGATLVFHHFQAVHYGENIYVIGAFTGNYPHETPIPDIWKLNIKTNTWFKGQSLPQDRLRGSAGCVSYENKVYMIGGIQDGHYDGHVKWFDEYDPKTGTWKILPDAPHARDHFAAVVVKNKLYAIGGRRSSAVSGQVFSLTVPEVDVYDFKSKSWTSLPAAKNLQVPRAGSSVVAFKSKIYLIGGESTRPMAHQDVDIFDTETQTWTKGPNLIVGRHGSGAGVIDGKIHIACGCATKGGGKELNDLETLTIK